MADTEVTLQSLRAMAQLAGLEISDQRLETLLPLIQRTSAATNALDEVLDLDGVEPAITFEAGVGDAGQR